jgi:hypothetical protein
MVLNIELSQKSDITMRTPEMRQKHIQEQIDNCVREANQQLSSCDSMYAKRARLQAEIDLLLGEPSMEGAEKQSTF